MRKISFILSAVVVAALFVTSCNPLKKMKDKQSLVKYEVKPSPLEMHNGEVAVEITVKYPAKFFNKKAVLVLTPTLKYEGGETPMEAKTLQGEGIKENNQVVKFAEGGNITYTGKVAYKDEMMRSDLIVKAVGKLKGKDVPIGEIKIADGINVTPLLVDKSPKVYIGADQFQRVTMQSKDAEILYLINSSNLRSTELSKAEVKALKEYMKKLKGNERASVKGMEINAYASPDGSEKLNDNLSKGRKSSSERFLKDEIKKDKLQDVAKSDMLKTLATAEDWDGFKALMEASNVQDKELVLRVLSMYSDPVVREKEIKNIAKAWTEIKTSVLPKLRRAKLAVKADITGYSDEEMVQIANSNMDTLNMEELLYAATLVQDLDKKLALYQKAAAKYPSDFRGQNNVGCILIKMKKIDEAKAALEAAKAIQDNDIVKNNMGCIAMLEGDMAKAEEIFTSAAAAGDVPNYNLGTISIIKGKYDAAVNFFGSQTGFNAALAKVLNKQYDAALSALGGIKEDDAKNYYLKAIIYVKSDKTDDVFNNLRTAVAKDGALKAYAKKDVEFLKYFNDDTFKSIVQ
jgi:tetratricopeptide (TPR) repeat protein